MSKALDGLAPRVNGLDLPLTREFELLIDGGSHDAQADTELTALLSTLNA